MEGGLLPTEYWAWPMFVLAVLGVVVGTVKMHLYLRSLALKTKTQYFYRDPVSMAMMYAAVRRRDRHAADWPLYVLWGAAVLAIFALIGLINCYAALPAPP